MAIGGDYSNNNSSSNGTGKLFENTYYSRLKIKNQDGKLNLGFSFRSGLLIVEIDEIKEGFKIEPVESIFLSPTKASILLQELRKFREYLDAGNIEDGVAFGVNAGMNEKVSYIAFHASKDRTIFITIGKIDGSGNILEKCTISLNREYHFGLEWKNVDAMDVEKVTYDSIELDQITNIIEDFSRAMNGVYAYSVADLTRYDSARVLKKMDPIYDKLGIERRTSGGYSNSKPNNFINNLGGGSSNHTSMDEISDLLED